METGKGDMSLWKEQTTADEIFRQMQQGTESQAGRLLEYTPDDGINKRVTPAESMYLKTMCDAADYLGPAWEWLKRSRVHHEIYGMCQGKRQAARDDFGTVLSRDLQEKRQKENGGFFDRLLGRFGGGGGDGD